MFTDAIYRLRGIPLSLDKDTQTLILNCSNKQEYAAAIAVIPQAVEIASGVKALYVARRLGSIMEAYSLEEVGALMNDLTRGGDEGQKKFLTPSDMDGIIRVFEERGEAVSIIRMSDDIQLMTTAKQFEHCGVKKDVWTGLCARDYFSDDQYAYYRSQLERYLGESCEVTYRAFRIDPDSLSLGEERLISVRARTAQSDEGWLRIVETLADETLPAI